MNKPTSVSGVEVSLILALAAGIIVSYFVGYHDGASQQKESDKIFEVSAKAEATTKAMDEIAHHYVSCCNAITNAYLAEIAAKERAQ